MFEFGQGCAINTEKHGISFEEAQKLWEDLDMITLEALVKGENRQINIAQLKGKSYTAITTLRGENIRIISVRRSRKDEIEAYHNGRI